MSSRHPTIDINIFMNHCAPSIDGLPVFATTKGVLEYFSKDRFAAIRFFCDSEPFDLDNKGLISRLRSELNFKFEFYRTAGLADGYAQAIRASTAEYLFQLEHDWSFIAGGVTHSLETIISAMELTQIPYLRFNQRANFNAHDETLAEFESAIVPMCATTMFSNNPHILNRQLATELYLPYISTERGRSAGVEENLTARYRAGWIYGPLGYPATIQHTDGKNATRTWRRASQINRVILGLKKYRRRISRRIGLIRYGRLH